MSGGSRGCKRGVRGVWERGVREGCVGCDGCSEVCEGCSEVCEGVRGMC